MLAARHAPQVWLGRAVSVVVLLVLMAAQTLRLQAAPVPQAASLVQLSELHISPRAVQDVYGEWIELANWGDEPVDLYAWQLLSYQGESMHIRTSLVIEPGGYVVLARQADLARNGGVQPTYVYSGLDLANQGDYLQLLNPEGHLVDMLAWGDGTDLQVTDGASLERTAPDGEWVTAHAPWPGSAGDRGSPGAPYTAPLPTPAPTETPVPTQTPAPTHTATPVPTATPAPLPAAWPLGESPSPLQIDEVYYHTADQEYIVLRNASTSPLPLAGWLVGDADIPGNREGMVSLPADQVLAPGALFVLAHSAAGFASVWGRAPDAEWGETDPVVPTLPRQHALASGEIALNDGGDQVLLLDPQGRVADALTYGDGAGQGLGLVGAIRCNAQCSLQQPPGAPYPAVRDVRHRFLLAAPDPFTAAMMPTPHPQAPVPLDGGMMGQWGTLGATSTFSPGGSAPPHYLVAAAAALGLDFIAIADVDPDPVVRIAATDPLPAHPIPAWRWQTQDGDNAIVYTHEIAALSSWADLLAFLTDRNAIAQVTRAEAAADARLAAITADGLAAPGDLAWLAASWQTAGMPLLPAGNTNPPLPGYYPPAPRYTGLAVTHADAAGVLDALQARRGWLTSTPGLWLTLRTDSGDWMGTAIAPGNELHLHIQYGDRDSTPAGLAIWQNGQVVRQLDQPPADGRWTVTLPAVPGAFVFAVATQLDGDFAVTAPIHVRPAAGGSVLINEVLPAPAADFDGDGRVDSSDEFIELFNPGTAPVALAGWQISDSAGDVNGRRVALDSSRAIGAGERMLLLRRDTGVSLNNDGDRLTLWDPNGAAVDSVEWDAAPADGASISRVPDGGAWQTGTPPTPGEANQPAPAPPPIVPPPAAPVDKPDRHDDQHDTGSDPAEDPLPPTHGQATGPPASLADAKLQGLEREVEFRAQVVVPPGLFNNVVYVAEAARTLDNVTLPIAGLGIQVYLQSGTFMPLQEGDWVLVRGVLKSFRGEMEVQVDEPGRVWPIGPGTPLLPLPVTVGEIGESLEGRLVHFSGVVTHWQGDSIYLGDPADPSVEPVRVTVRSSLDWKRPYVQKGERYEVTGIVSQFAQKAPWNGGYRVLVRYPSDLVRIE